MYHMSATRTKTREYVDIPNLIKEEKLITIQFYGAHYEGLLLENIPSREPSWPVSESHNIFHPSVYKKLCPICNTISRSYEEATVNFCLCHLWVHCNKESSCGKH